MSQYVVIRGVEYEVERVGGGPMPGVVYVDVRVSRRWQRVRAALDGVMRRAVASAAWVGNSAAVKLR